MSSGSRWKSEELRAPSVAGGGKDGGGVTDLKDTDEHPILSPDSRAAVGSSDLENNGYSERVFWRVHTTETLSVPHSAQEHSGCDGRDCNSRCP